MARYRPRYDHSSGRRDTVDETLSSRRSRSPEELVDSYRPAKRPRIPEPVMNRPNKKQRPPPKQRVADRTSLSSRVHSLRKLLDHSTRMPADVRQEKERELASLLVEQQEKSAEKSKKKNLAKYHMVRFMERQKCERKLKRLRKLLSELQDSRVKGDRETTAGDVDMDDEDDGVALPDEEESDLLRQIHTAQIDLNYTLYAPLGDKYIALFAATEPQKIAGMSKANQALLTEEQKAEVLDKQNDALGCLRNLTGEKPPVWHQVENCMAAGTLNQLRDGKISGTTTTTITTVGGKVEAATQGKPVADWINDDGAIAPEDLDSDSNLSDGGFFER